MAIKYHINSQGQVGRCAAQKNCPFGGDNEHYDSSQDARRAYEKVMEAGGQWLPASKKEFAGARRITPEDAVSISRDLARVAQELKDQPKPNFGSPDIERVRNLKEGMSTIVAGIHVNRVRNGYTIFPQGRDGSPIDAGPTYREAIGAALKLNRQLLEDDPSTWPKEIAR